MTVEDKKALVDNIIDRYIDESEVCMAEFLASEFPRNLSYEEAFEIYIECMRRVEGDRFFVIKEGETIEL